MPDQQIPNELIFGEFNPDGSVKRLPRVVANPEGQRIESGDVRIRIAGTPYFYYVKYLRLLSPEDRSAIESRVQSPAPAESPAPAAKPAFSSRSVTKSEATPNDSSN